jgi:endonuclease G
MTPSDDMPDMVSQRETFSTANLVPQHPDNNRATWRAVESLVRKLPYIYGDIYIVSGPVHKSEHPKMLKGRETVPDYIFKAVFIPSINTSGVYITTNDSASELRLISVKELADMSEIDPFPDLSDSVKAGKFSMPLPVVERPKAK